MAVYKRGDVWWFKFSWKGELIRESTKQGNKRVAEQIESARKTQLAKGEVGIRDKKPVPTLARFAEHDFLPFVRSTSAAKPRTVVFYENSVRNLMGYDKLVGLKMDAITSEVIAGFVAKRRDADMEVSTINRDIATACSTWRKSGNESRPSCRRCGCCPERINASACSPQTRNWSTWTRR